LAHWAILTIYVWPTGNRSGWTMMGPLVHGGRSPFARCQLDASAGLRSSLWRPLEVFLVPLWCYWVRNVWASRLPNREHWMPGEAHRLFCDRVTATRARGFGRSRRMHPEVSVFPYDGYRFQMGGPKSLADRRPRRSGEAHVTGGRPPWGGRRPKCKRPMSGDVVAGTL
jgi:hypothetical protein